MLKGKETCCRYCGREIVMVKLLNGKTMPVDPDILYIERDVRGEPYTDMNGAVIFGREVGDAYDDPEAEVIQVFKSHRVTCPEGGRRRKRR